MKNFKITSRIGLTVPMVKDWATMYCENNLLKEDSALIDLLEKLLLLLDKSYLTNFIEIENRHSANEIIITITDNLGRTHCYTFSWGDYSKPWNDFLIKKLKEYRFLNQDSTVNTSKILEVKADYMQPYDYQDNKDFMKDDSCIDALSTSVTIANASLYIDDTKLGEVTASTLTIPSETCTIPNGYTETNPKYGKTITTTTYEPQFNDLNTRLNNLELKIDRKEDKKLMATSNANTNSFSFDSINFGPFSDPRVRLSPYGIAVKNIENKFVSYDAAKDEIVNVDVMNMNGNNMIFSIPVAINDVAPGDVILHNGTPMHVKKAEDNALVVIDPAVGEVKMIMPAKSPFGFDFVSKLVTPYASLKGTASKDNPFGDPMMLMMMNGNVNPMMMLALAGKTDIDPMMMMLLNDKTSDNSGLLMYLMMTKKDKKDSK